MRRGRLEGNLSRLGTAAGVVLQSVPDVLWIALLVTLPVTSLPFLVHLTRGAIVAGASGLPLAILALVWYLPWLWRNRKLPSEAAPLIAFGLIALVAGLLAFFIEIHPFKEQTVFGRGSEALATLSLGIAYFLITATFVADRPGRLRSSLKWIQVGILVALIWSAVQAYFILCCGSDYPDRIRALHRLISIRDPYVDRVTGMAYEPSWFAHQLNLLYFPLLLASVSLGYSAFRRRILGLQFELFLLIAGIAALVLSTSRVGLAGFLLMAGLTVLWLAFRAGRRLNEMIRHRLLDRYPLLARFAGAGSSAVISIGFLVGFIAAAVALVVVAAQLDWRWQRVLTPIGANLFSVQSANYFLFAERVVFWIAAYGVFEHFPVLGVGLGNSGFFIPETMPEFGWTAPEVVNVLRAGTEFFPNPKALWFRLLAETGIVGFVMFVVWLLVMAIRAIMLSIGKERLRQVVGVLGLLTLIGLLTEGFSIDSFAFPYLWVAMGLVTAAGWRARREASAASSKP